MSLTVKNDDVTSGRRNVDPARAVTAGLGAKWNKLDLVKITLEGNPKMLDHSDK